MGAGEAYVDVWWNWWTKQRKEEADALAFFRQWPPADAWLAWVGHALWPDTPDGTDEDEAVLVRRLETLGIGTYERWHAAFNAPPEGLDESE
jgi:hypothetical protein